MPAPPWGGISRPVGAIVESRTVTDLERAAARAALEIDREHAKIDWYAAVMAGSRGGVAKARKRIKELEKQIRRM